MAKRSISGPEVPVTPEVRRFLSENGRKGGRIGGAITRRLVELGKEAARHNNGEKEPVVEMNEFRNKRRSA